MVQSIGMYNNRVTGGPEPTLYADTPFYSARSHYLDSIKAWQLQIEINFLGEFIWINVRPEDNKS